MDIQKIKKYAIFLSILLLIIISLFLYHNPLFSNKPFGLDTLGHLSKVSYIKEFGLTSWDMSWYNGGPFLKFYPPLFYYVVSLFPNFIFGANFICFLSILLSSIGIFLLVKHYTKKVTNSLIAALLFLSVINISYFFISVGNLPYIFSLWTIPFTLLFLEKSLNNRKNLIIYSLIFLIGFLSHIFIGLCLLLLVFIRILTYTKLDFRRILNLSFLLLIIPIGLTFFWFLPFLTHSSSFIGGEIFIPSLASLLGIKNNFKWGLGLGSIGIGFIFFIFSLFFIKKNFKDNKYRYILFSSILFFALLMGILGPYYPRGIASIRFIAPFSILLCIFIGISFNKLNLKKYYLLIFVLIFISLFINYNIIKTNYEEHSYSSADLKYGQFAPIYEEFYKEDFPINNQSSNYRFGAARFPFSGALTFVFPKISQTSGYYDQGILYEDTFYKMKNAIWYFKNINETLYYLDWFGIEYFELSGGYLENEEKFSNNNFEFVLERNLTQYPYKIYGYKNARPIISVIKTNFVSFEELDEEFIDGLARENKNTEIIVPFISKKKINITNSYSILNFTVKRESPDIAEVNFDEFTGEEGILFKEFYYPSWKAKEFPSEENLEIYRTANNMMLVLPTEGSKKVVFYQSKLLLDYFGIAISLLSLVLLIFILKKHFFPPQ